MESIVDERPSLADRQVVTAEVDPIRQQYGDALDGRLAPEARAGEAEVPKGAWSTQGTCRRGSGRDAVEASAQCAPRTGCHQVRQSCPIQPVVPPSSHDVQDRGTETCHCRRTAE